MTKTTALHVCQLIKIYRRNVLKELKVLNETEIIPAAGEAH